MTLFWTMSQSSSSSLFSDMQTAMTGWCLASLAATRSSSRSLLYLAA